MAQFFATDLVSAYANHLYHPDWTTDVDADARDRYESGKNPGTTLLDVENSVNIPGAGSGQVWRYATHAFIFDEFSKTKTLDGTISVDFRVSDEGGGADDRISGGWAVFRVLDSAGNQVHSSAFDGQTIPDGGDQRVTLSAIFSSVSVSAGDVLVVEVGTYHANNNASSSSASVPTKLYFNSTDTIDITVPDGWFNIFQPPPGTASGSAPTPVVTATGAKIAIIADTALGEVPKTRDLFINLGYDVTLVNDDDVGTHDFSVYDLIVTTRNDDSATAVAELDNIWQTHGIPFMISTMDRNVSSGSLAVEALEEMGLATGTFTYTGNSGDATSFVRNVDHPIVDEFGSRTFDIIDDGTANPDTWMVYYNDINVTTIATTVIANNGDMQDDTKKSTFAVEKGTTDLHSRPTPSRVVVTDTLYGGGPGESYTADASDWFEALTNWLLTDPSEGVDVAAVSGTSTSSANAPTVSTTSNASAPTGTSTGTATVPTVSTSSVAPVVVGTANGSAPSPTVSTGVGVSTPVGASTGAASAPAMSTTYEAVVPAGTSSGSANAPTISAGIDVNALTATGTGAALEPTYNIHAPVDAVTGTASGTAIAPTALAEFHIDAAVPVGTGSGTAPAPSSSVGSEAIVPVGTAIGTAPVPMVSDNVAIDALAGTASGSAVSPSVTATTNVTASTPSGTASGHALAPTTVIDYVVTAPVAIGAGSALLPSINVDVPVPVAAGSGSTVAPTVQTAVDAVIPTGDATGEGHSPSIRADVAAQIPLASGQGGATLPTITPVTNASVASTGADGQAVAPTVAVVRNYDLDIPTATSVGEAKAPAIEISREVDAPSGTGVGVGVAPDVSTNVEIAIPTAGAQAGAEIPILPHRNVRVTVGTAQSRALTPLYVDELPESQASTTTAGNEEGLSTHDNRAIVTLSDSNASLTSGGNRAVLVLTTE